MTVKDILAVASYIVLSVGGSGAIICALSKFLAERIANRIDSKYQNRLNQQLEEYKDLLAHKNYVSQTQFDTEFQIYKQLSKAYFAVIVKASSFSKYQQKDKTISKEELFRMIDVNGEAQDILFENEPFIPEEIFNKYLDLNEKTSDFFFTIIDRIEKNMKEGKRLDECEIRTSEDIYVSESLQSELREINKDVRHYLESLSIVRGK